MLRIFRLQLAAWICVFSGCWWTGCGSEEPTAQDPSPTPVEAGLTSPPVPSLTTSQAPAQVKPIQAQVLRETFADAEARTKGRIEEALQFIAEGRTREGIGHLKMVEADTELTAPQQQAILNTIISIRQAEP